MKFTREQVIEMAEEAGITSDDAVCQVHDLTRLCTLAADRALEAAAVKCDQRQQHELAHDRGSAAISAYDCAYAIRAMKEQA